MITHAAYNDIMRRLNLDKEAAHLRRRYSRLFINHLTKWRSRKRAREIFKGALEDAHRRLRLFSGTMIMIGAVHASAVFVKVLRKRVKGRPYPVPVRVREAVAISEAVRNILARAKKRDDPTWEEKLGAELPACTPRLNVPPPPPPDRPKRPAVAMSALDAYGTRA